MKRKVLAFLALYLVIWIYTIGAMFVGFTAGRNSVPRGTISVECPMCGSPDVYGISIGSSLNGCTTRVSNVDIRIGSEE